jgi:hypothetical protein
MRLKCCQYNHKHKHQHKHQHKHHKHKHNFNFLSAADQGASLVIFSLIFLFVFFVFYSAYIFSLFHPLGRPLSPSNGSDSITGTRERIPGTRYQVPGTRYQVLAKQYPVIRRSDCLFLFLLFTPSGRPAIWPLLL